MREDVGNKVKKVKEKKRKSMFMQSKRTYITTRNDVMVVNRNENLNIFVQWGGEYSICNCTYVTEIDDIFQEE